jgi:hypothetical protein
MKLRWSEDTWLISPSRTIGPDIRQRSTQSQPSLTPLTKGPENGDSELTVQRIKATLDDFLCCVSALHRSRQDGGASLLGVHSCPDVSRGVDEPCCVGVGTVKARTELKGRRARGVGMMEQRPAWCALLPQRLTGCSRAVLCRKRGR